MKENLAFLLSNPHHNGRGESTPSSSVCQASATGQQEEGAGMVQQAGYQPTSQPMRARPISATDLLCDLGQVILSLLPGLFCFFAVHSKDCFFICTHCTVYNWVLISAGVSTDKYNTNNMILCLFPDLSHHLYHIQKYPSRFSSLHLCPKGDFSFSACLTSHFGKGENTNSLG